MYSIKIQEERQDAHDSNVANKIIDMMDKLRLSANTNTPRRWIWELLQNAKDVSNPSGKVKIKINLDEGKRTLEFSHNGNPFSTKNIVFLIEQVSTKERDNAKPGKEKTTGKFGTGFLTTHLLSEIVTVKGFLSDDKEPMRKFKVTLNRSGKSKKEIVGAIRNAFEELENSEVVGVAENYNFSEYNTAFKYALDEKGIEVAKIGIEDLKISIPYVFALTPQIEEIYIESENIKYRLIRKSNCKLQDSYVYTIQEMQGAAIRNHFVLLVKDEFVTVAVHLESKDGKVWIKEFNKKQPKIFCDFPLVGTDEFPLPVIVNSELFNPTEPRDGIYLTDNENEEIDENKRLILKACELYKSLLEHASENGWLGLYNITSVKTMQAKEWCSTEWLNENVVDNCRQYIKYCPIIDNTAGKRVALYNDDDEIQVEIPNNSNEKTRNGIWELCSKWIPNNLPRRDDVHCWCESLWSDCITFDLDKLTRKIESLENITILDLELEGGISPEGWLNEYYALIKNDTLIKNDKRIDDIVSEEYAVIPNQNGAFKKSRELFLDADVDEEYKDILSILGEDCKEYLLDKSVNTGEIIRYEKIENSNIIAKIEEELKRASDELKKEVYSRILVLYDKEHKEFHKQIKVIEYAGKLFEDCLQECKCVKSISEELLEKSIKYMATLIADAISEQENLDNFTSCFNFENRDDALEWLSKLIEYLVSSDFDNLLNKLKRPILPNQKGQFVTKDDLFLDDGEIDDELKDIATIAGYDIRNELLDKAIYLKLPENRERHVKDLAEPIVRFVKNNLGNRMNQSQEIKSTFKRIFIWIDENTDLAKKIFPEICENKHWLYDDKEIASNMKKAEAYDALMEKYNIADAKSLEKLLQEKHTSDFDIDSKEGITEDLLIQSGIYSDESLQAAMTNAFFSDNFVHLSESDVIKFDSVQKILERSKKNVLNYLKGKKEYDLSSILEIDKTIYLVRKNNEEIYLIIRPSDYGQVILYYDSEKDILDYEKDWELWVEDNVNLPQKITFGKMLKLTGINKIPLKRIR